MKPITQQEIADYVEAHIQVFHRKRLDSLQKLKLMDVVNGKKLSNLIQRILHLENQFQTQFGSFQPTSQ